MEKSLRCCSLKKENEVVSLKVLQPRHETVAGFKLSTKTIVIKKNQRFLRITRWTRRTNSNCFGAKLKVHCALAADTRGNPLNGRRSPFSTVSARDETRQCIHLTMTRYVRPQYACYVFAGNEYTPTGARFADNRFSLSSRRHPFRFSFISYPVPAKGSACVVPRACTRTQRRLNKL